MFLGVTFLSVYVISVSHALRLNSKGDGILHRKSELELGSFVSSACNFLAKMVKSLFYGNLGVWGEMGRAGQRV